MEVEMWEGEHVGVGMWRWGCGDEDVGVEM